MRPKHDYEFRWKPNYKGYKEKPKGETRKPIARYTAEIDGVVHNCKIYLLHDPRPKVITSSIMGA